MYDTAFPGVADHYLPPLVVVKYLKKINDEDQEHYSADKVFFRNILEAEGLPVVRELFSVDPSGAIRDGSGAVIDAVRARELAEAHGGDLFVKPVVATWGNGARIIRAGAIPPDFPGDRSGRKDMIVQPVLRQHPTIAAIYPDAINTVRIDTLKTEAGIINNAAVLRMGSGGAIIDNGSAGGLIAGINLDSGRLYPTARRKPKYGTEVFRRHPDTGTAFEGITVPFWEEILATVARAAQHLPFESLGWDVAVTPDGPVLIECNTIWDSEVFQLGWGGLGATEFGRRACRHLGFPEIPQSASRPREIGLHA